MRARVCVHTHTSKESQPMEKEMSGKNNEQRKKEMSGNNTLGKPLLCLWVWGEDRTWSWVAVLYYLRCFL